jgi:predicted transcriptional regulator
MVNSEVNVNKMRTKTLVALLPGIHLRRLQRLLGTSFSTTRYHVDSLLREGKIVSAREGGYTRLFPSGMEEDEMKIHSSLQNKNTRHILRALVNSRFLSKRELSVITGLSKSTIAKQIGTMGILNLVERHESRGEELTYGIRDYENVTLILSSLERNFLDVATDSFIDLWKDY